jgi:hypothetical protein
MKSMSASHVHYYSGEDVCHVTYEMSHMKSMSAMSIGTVGKMLNSSFHLFGFCPHFQFRTSHMKSSSAMSISIVGKMLNSPFHLFENIAGMVICYKTLCPFRLSIY